MQRKPIGNNVSPLPQPMTIVGSKYQGRANFMALAWVTRVQYSPCYMAIAVSKRHATAKAIMETGQFSINIPGTDLVDRTDLVGMVSGKQYDKSSPFTVEYGELEAAPLIAECPVSMELKVVKTVDVPSDWLFIGEMINAWSTEEYLTEGALNIERIQPFMLTMPDNRYWGIGKEAGTAWNEGKELKDSLHKI